MKFASIRYLILLLTLPAAFALLAFSFRRARKTFAEFADSKLWPLIAPNARFDVSKRRMTSLMLALFFMTLAMTRPQWGVDTEVVKTTGMDVVFALDVSRSMNVEDIAPNRLKKAKRLIRSIVEELGGDRVALVTFAGVADLAVPLTTDTEYFFNRLESSDPEDAMIQGTDLGAALSLARTALERGGENQTQSASRVIVLLTDAEDNEGEGAEEIRKIDPASTRFYAIGLGSDTGGPVPIRDDSGSLSAYKRDSSGKPVVSKPDFKLLETLAASVKGKAFRASQGEGEVNALVEELQSLKRGELDAKEIQVFHERFQWPLFLGLFFLLLETLFSKLPLTLWILGFFIAASSPSAQADSGMEGYSRNREGVKAFESGNLKEAKNRFEEAVKAEPNRAEHLFNDATTELLSENPAPEAGQSPSSPAEPGEASEAITKLEAAAEKSKENPSIEARSRFNLGTAYAKKGEMENALKSYLSAIDAAKRANDPELEKMARKNIELLANEQQKQQQQKKQDQKSDPSDSNQKKDESQAQGSDQNNQSGKNDKEKQAQQKRYQDSKRNKGEFRSQKISKEDADRAMSELYHREREVNARLRKRNSGVKRMVKDW